jgi:hypothetical protein
MDLVEKYLNESKRAIDFIMGQLMNDESSSDAEMILHLSQETHIPIAKISKLVKAERNNFLKDTMMSKDVAMKIVKKYI